MDNLSRDELIELYKKMPEKTLRKMGYYEKAKNALEQKEKEERQKKNIIDQAVNYLYKIIQSFESYGLSLTISNNNIIIKDGTSIIHRSDLSKNQDNEKVSNKRKPITPQDLYTIPLLESLVELGGSARSGDVLDRVYLKMKDILIPADFEMLKSGKQVRWRNRTAWERNNLVNVKGYMRKDSPTGIWEISDEGREYLKKVKCR